MVGPIHIHPNGCLVYLGNRASGVIESKGKKFATGGETTGEPIDPTARMPMAANLLELPVRDALSPARDRQADPSVA